MKIKLIGNTPFIRNVEVELTSVGMHVHVTTQERWGPAHIQGGSSNYFPAPGDERAAYDTLVFSNPACVTDVAEEASRVEVLVIAESEEDELLLRSRLRYSHQEKDTFSVLYLPFTAFADTKPLASLPA